MKTSEAIRKGCEMVPRQAWDAWNTNDGVGRIVSACAITAAVIGRYGTAITDDDIVSHAVEELGLLTRLSSACPQCGRSSREPDVVGEIVLHLNDEHRWSRERIASWLDERGL